MYKAIVVDDEKIIRDTLTSTFNWDEFGITEVYEASDGEDAWEIIKQARPHIVLTDIKMPVIDGLQLSSMVKEQFNDIVTIVLSGFDEFALVKKALNIGVFDYLLKPIREDELKAVIKRAVDLVEKNLAEKIEQSMLKCQAVEANRAIKEKLLNSLIINSQKEAESTLAKLNALGLNLKFEKFFTVIFYLEEESKEICIGKGFDAQLLMFSISNIANECCSRLTKNYELFATTDNNAVLIVDNVDCNSHEILQLLAQIRECVRNFLKVDIITGMSKNYCGVHNIKASYNEAYEAVEKNLYFGFENAISANEDMVKLSANLFKEKEKALINNIYLCDNEKVESIIEEIFVLAASLQLPLKKVKALNMSMINCIADIANEVGCEINDGAGDEKSIYEKIDEYKSIERFKLFIKNMAFRTIEGVRKRNSTKKKKTIDKVLKYIDEHLSENITLYSISEKFYLDYTNLSKMFKEDVGKLFSKYLIDARINRARELLKTSKMKIYEISESVGYTDVRYFTKLFKESEGVTPAEYRKNIGIIDIDQGEAVR